MISEDYESLELHNIVKEICGRVAVNKRKTFTTTGSCLI